MLVQCGCLVAFFFFCRPSGSDDAFSQKPWNDSTTGTRPGAHTPAITVRPRPRPMVDLSRHTRLGLQAQGAGRREKAGGHDGGEIGEMARRHMGRTRNPGPFGKRGFLGGSIHASTLPRPYAWTASTPGWLAAERVLRVCVRERVPVSPLSNVTAPPLCLVPTGIAPETHCRGVSTFGSGSTSSCAVHPQRPSSCPSCPQPDSQTLNEPPSQAQTGPETRDKQVVETSDHSRSCSYSRWAQHPYL